MRQILFFNPAATGHHGEFFENLIHGLDPNIATRAVMVASCDLEERLVRAVEESGSPVRLDFLNAQDLAVLKKAKSPREIGNIEHQVLAEKIQQWGATDLVILYMNRLQLTLRTPLSGTDLRVRGVLLNSYTPLHRVSGLKNRLLQGIGNRRKLVQFAWMLRNPQLCEIFLLNDPQAVSLLNKQFAPRSPFTVLVDPIPVAVKHVRRPENREKRDRQVFLLFGSMDPRKGVLEVLKAFEKVPPCIRQHAQLRLVGPHNKNQSFREACAQAVEKLSLSASELQIEQIERRIGFDELEAVFQSTDYLLLPYIRFYGSSGLIGHACAAGVPIVLRI